METSKMTAKELNDKKIVKTAFVQDESIAPKIMPLLKREFGIYHNINEETMFRDAPLKDGEKRDFKYIGSVLATDINEAWKLAQNDFNEEYAQLGVRSTSVGDMILDGNDFYFIKGTGFEYIISIDPEGGE